MAKKLKSPHLLLAANNPKNLRSNVAHLLSKKSLAAIDKELTRNVVALFSLGKSHFTFASTTSISEWRQKISRLYYAAYNAKRAVDLQKDGHFATDNSDHKNIEQLPDTFPKRSTYGIQLKTLREDRNLADYNHDSDEHDLAISVADAEKLVRDFIDDARTFLRGFGVKV